MKTKLLSTLRTRANKEFRVVAELGKPTYSIKQVFYDDVWVSIVVAEGLTKSEAIKRCKNEKREYILKELPKYKTHPSNREKLINELTKI